VGKMAELQVCGKCRASEAAVGTVRERRGQN
jgi:hypothetical protein